MDAYLSQYLTLPCLYGVYSYYDWYTLRNNKYVPPLIWQRICDHFYEDSEFQKKWDTYRCKDFLTRKEWLLHYLNHVLYTGEYDVPILWTDKAFVLLYLRRRGITAVHKMHAKLKCDPDIALMAVKYNVEILSHLRQDLKYNRDFMLRILRKNGLALQYIPMQDDDYIRTALQQNGLALQYVKSATREHIMIAVQEDGGALQYVNPPFNMDREIIIKAAINNNNALMYIDTELHSDDDFMYALLLKDAYVLPYASERLRSDPDIVLLAIQKGRASLFEYAGGTLKSDREFVLRAMHINYQILIYIDAKLKIDPEILLYSLKMGVDILGTTDTSLKEDSRFMLKAIKINAYYMRYASRGLQTDKNFVIKAVLLNPQVVHYIGFPLHENYDIQRLAHVRKCVEWCLDDLEETK